MSEEFLIIPARPLNHSDFIEFDLVSGVLKRNGALQSIIEPSLTRKANQFAIVSQLLKSGTNWLSPKFPHGSARGTIRRRKRALACCGWHR
jgi:hypothetical protein